MACDIIFWCDIVQLSQQNTQKLILGPSGEIWALFIRLNRTKKNFVQNLGTEYINKYQTNMACDISFWRNFVQIYQRKT